MNRVTYILGAGFSAPLGLPVMSNFLFKSKDMYYENFEKYEHFKQVFDSIEKISVLKNYYSSDLFNIEEILSITEMMDFVDGKRLSEAFIRYITDVIDFYTPELKPYPEKRLPGNWQDFVLGNRDIVGKYAYFVGSLLKLNFSSSQKNMVRDGEDSREFRVAANNDLNTSYSVLTLNYDLVLENVLKFFKSRYSVNEGIGFIKNEYDPEWRACHLAKLHGCIDEGMIVPPTWAKGTHPNVVPSWKMAYQALRDSNHIRFIGYSLPVSDSYIKYLLKSAVVNCKHLKTIDVICLDPDGSVKSRFDDLLEFNHYRFKNASVSVFIEDLVNAVHQNRRNSQNDAPLTLNVLDDVHAHFMST